MHEAMASETSSETKHILTVHEAVKLRHGPSLQHQALRTSPLSAPPLRPPGRTSAYRTRVRQSMYLDVLATETKTSDACF